MGEQLYRGVGEFMPDGLIADAAIPAKAKGIKVAKGEGMLKRGTLLGKAGDGTYRRTGVEIAESGSAIGADCILADDVDATEAEVVAAAYVTGGFNAAAIILPEGQDVREHETTLRQLGIFLDAVQEYGKEQ